VSEIERANIDTYIQKTERESEGERKRKGARGSDTITQLHTYKREGEKGEGWRERKGGGESERKKRFFAKK